MGGRVRSEKARQGGEDSRKKGERRMGGKALLQRMEGRKKVIFVFPVTGGEF